MWNSVYFNLFLTQRRQAAKNFYLNNRKNFGIFAPLRETQALGHFNAQYAGRDPECLKRVSESKGCRKNLISIKWGG
jgi:hypothetical protein